MWLWKFLLNKVQEKKKERRMKALEILVRLQGSPVEKAEKVYDKIFHKLP